MTACLRDIVCIKMTNHTEKNEQEVISTVAQSKDSQLIGLCVTRVFSNYICGLGILKDEISNLY
jgi:hypothetical protein